MKYINTILLGLHIIYMHVYDDIHVCVRVYAFLCLCVMADSH